MTTISDALAIGMQLHQSGSLGQAEQIYAQVLQHVPRQPDALHLMGLLAHQQGQQQRAMDLIAAAISVDDQNPLYHNNLAEAKKAAGALDEARASYEDAVRLAPSFAEAQLNLGNLLMQQREFERALMVLQRAIEARPDYLAALNSLAAVHAEMGHAEQAIALYQQLIQKQPNKSSTRQNLGLLYHRLGNQREAVSQYTEAIRLAPDYAENYLHLAAVKTEGLDDSHLSAARAIVARDTSAAAHFAVAWTLEQRGHYEEAWTHYQQGNRVLQEHRSGKQYSQGECEQFTDKIIHEYTPDVYSAMHSGMATHPRRPIVLASLPRSGSSLVEQILACHDDVCAAGESGQNHLLLRAILAMNEDGLDFPEAALHLTEKQRTELAAHYLADVPGVDSQTERVTEKSTDNFRFLGLIAQIFPQAKIVVCQRDSWDTTLSCYCQRFMQLPFTNSIDDLAHYYRQYERLIRHWTETLPLPMHVVQYEQLVADPEPVIRELADFCELSWTDEFLRHHEQTRMVKTASAAQVRKQIYGSSVERWRRFPQFQAEIAPLLPRNDGDLPATDSC